MRKQFSVAIASLFFCAAAHAQTVFHFTSPVTQKSMQEAATIIRTVADIPQVTILEAQQTIQFQGPAAQVVMAQWILTQLDTPGNENALLQYTLPTGDDVVRVNFLANVTTNLEAQEMLTTLRTVADIAKVFNYSERQAMVIRASSADLAFAEWIVDQLNVPVTAKLDATPRVYTGAVKGYGPNAKTGETARVNYLTNGATQQGTQQIMTVLRMVGIIQKVFVYTDLHALTLRGPASEIARCEWLIQQLAQPAAQGTQVYETPNADDVTRIFFLSNATPQALIAAVTSIKAETHIQQAYQLTQPSAIVVRGTSDQIAAALQVMAQHNGLAMLEHR